MEDSPLLAYFKSHTEGLGIWKWSHYLNIYHRHFQRFVGKDVHVAEVGAYSGGSLEMWRHYFGERCIVYGIDTEEQCKEYENDHTRIFIGNQEHRDFWQLFKREVPRVDILIDDGGHYPNQQLVTFEEMLPHIGAGGIYVCEDIQNTRAVVAGSPEKHNEFFNYLASFARELNQLIVTDRGVTTTDFQRAIASVHFYPYLAIIEKVADPQETFVAPKMGSIWKPWA